MIRPLRQTCFFLMLAIFNLLPALPVLAQTPSFSQSSPTVDWRIIETEYARVIFPSYLEDTGNLVTSLINHYAEVAGKTFGITKPHQVTIVLRPETADPNGFVTLAPRRSEWFLSKSFTPMVGGLEFTQALSIHEFRHVIQFDFLNQKFNRFAYYISGEIGLLIGSAIGVPPWFFEGDAVWTETIYTDGGRGRSPRFAERLKAMLLSEQIPTYDQITSGTLTTVWPNHYVYGYYLVARAYRLFGDDVWKKILSETTVFPLNPYRFYNAFEMVTGQEFEKFYDETMAELAEAWKAPEALPLAGKNESYVAHYYPVSDRGDSGKQYYLKKTLDTRLQLYAREEKADRLIRQFSFEPALSRIDINRGRLAYVRNHNDPRYDYRAYSDIVIYDITKEKTDKLTKNGRFYHPQISPDGTKILAVEFPLDNNWRLSIMDMSGKVIQHIKIPEMIIDEAIWISDQKLVAIVEDDEGYKSLVELALNASDSKLLSHKVLLGRSRNNFFALAPSQQSFYFEADYEGAVQIFRMNLEDRQLAQCTFERVGAHSPSVYDNILSYTSVVANGTVIKQEPVNCKPSDRQNLLSFAYLGDGPSDHYTETKPVLIKDYAALVSQKHPSAPYNEWDGLLTPHSWGFFGGRGLMLEGETVNYLNTLKLSLKVGIDSEEQRPYQTFSFNYMKYYPVFSLIAKNRERNTRAQKSSDPNVTDRSPARYHWQESTLLLTMGLPFELWAPQQINMTVGQVATSGHREPENHILTNDRVLVTAVGYTLDLLSSPLRRQIYNPSGIFFYTAYEDDSAQRAPSTSAWVRYSNFKIFFPGILTNHGIKLTIDDEERIQGLNKYQRIAFASDSSNTFEYVFSRGFTHFTTPHYTKGSFDYALPLAYPDKSFGSGLYIKRIYTNLFYDFTRVERQEGGREFKKSAGNELYFDIKLLRILPLSLGLRYYGKNPDHKRRIHRDVYLTTSSAF